MRSSTPCTSSCLRLAFTSRGGNRHTHRTAAMSTSMCTESWLIALSGPGFRRRRSSTTSRRSRMRVTRKLASRRERPRRCTITLSFRLRTPATLTVIRRHGPIGPGKDDSTSSCRPLHDSQPTVSWFPCELIEGEASGGPGNRSLPIATRETPAPDSNFASTMASAVRLARSTLNPSMAGWVGASQMFTTGFRSPRSARSTRSIRSRT